MSAVSAACIGVVVFRCGILFCCEPFGVGTCMCEILLHTTSKIQLCTKTVPPWCHTTVDNGGCGGGVGGQVAVGWGKSGSGSDQQRMKHGWSMSASNLYTEDQGGWGGL